MLQSLRHQFLIPITIAVIGTAISVTLWSRWAADRNALQSTSDRLNSIASLCANAPFPLTANVLSQIEYLTQLKIAVVSDQGRVQRRSNGFPIDQDIDWKAVWPTTAFSTNGRASPEPIRSVTLGRNRYLALVQPLSDEESNRNDYERFLIVLESDERRQRSTAQAFWLPLITGICSAGVVALVATIVATRIGRRIESLNLQVNTIASGSFNSIKPTGPKDAIHSLAESVNTMSEQLAHSTSQIAKNERARLINLIASGLAHSLRNHLTGARLAIQTLNAEPKPDEAIGIALQQMQLAEEAIKRLLSVRFDGENVPSQPMNLSQIAQQVDELTRPIAEHHRVSFELLSGNANMALSSDDGSSIVGALLNLVINAIEATGPGGRVRCQLRSDTNSDPGSVVWLVSDDGPGPNPNIVDSMFEPFATTKREGVGIGLAVCVRIAQRNHGSISWSRTDDWTEFQFKHGLLH